MAIALVSDLHANIEALEAVMADIDAQGITKIYCLGDIIDYGPNPREVLDIALARFEVTILGNHEEALMAVAEDFNDRAMRSVIWTRDQLNDPEIPRETRRNWWNAFDSMAATKAVKQGEMLYLHGSPRQPTRDYVFPKDIKDRLKIDEMFQKLPEGVRFCFCGHSHIPGIYTQNYQYAHPSKMRDSKVSLDRFDKLIVNIGSVGQPRDQDTRASYVVIDGTDVYFRRVSYDVQKTAAKLAAIDELPKSLSTRLLVGK